MVHQRWWDTAQLVVRTQYMKMMVLGTQDLMQGAWKTPVFVMDGIWLGMRGTGNVNMSEGKTECRNSI